MPCSEPGERCTLHMTPLGMLARCSLSTKIHIKDMILNFMQRAPFAYNVLDGSPEGETDYSHLQNTLAHLKRFEVLECKQWRARLLTLYFPSVITDTP